MADTPLTVRVPIDLPLYVRLPSGEYIELGSVQTFVDVSVAASPGLHQDTPEPDRTVVTSMQVNRAGVLRDAADTVLSRVGNVWPFDRHPDVREAAEYAAEVLRAQARDA